MVLVAAAAASGCAQPPPGTASAPPVIVRGEPTDFGAVTVVAPGAIWFGVVATDEDAHATLTARLAGVIGAQQLRLADDIVLVPTATPREREGRFAERAYCVQLGKGSWPVQLTVSNQLYPQRSGALAGFPDDASPLAPGSFATNTWTVTCP